MPLPGSRPIVRVARVPAHVVRRALDAADDHPGWSHLRAEALAAWSGEPMPEPPAAVLPNLRKYTTGEMVRALRLLRDGPLSSADWDGSTPLPDLIVRLRKRGHVITSVRRARRPSVYTLQL